MKLTYIIIGGLLLQSSALAATTTIDLHTAIHLALTSNQKAQASHYQETAAAAAVKQARGEGLPNLNLEVNAARSDNPLNVFGYKLAQSGAAFSDFGAEEYQGPSSANTYPCNLNHPGYYNNVDTGIVLNVPIFSGGKATSKIHAAQNLSQAAQYASQSTENAVIYDVIQYYEGVHVAIELQQLAQNAASTTSKYLHMTRSLSQQSLVQSSDVALATTANQLATTNAQTAQFEIQNQLDLFHVALGHPDSKVLPGANVALTLTVSSDKKLQEILATSNTDLLALRSRLAASHDAIDSAKSSNWPDVNLQLRHDWNSETFTAKHPSDTAMLQMNWRLFSSGAQSSSTQNSIAAYKQANAELQNHIDSLNLAIAKDLRAIASFDLQLKTEQNNVRSLSSAVNSLTERYGRGAAALGQLLDAQSRLDTSKSNIILARYNKLLAQARILSSLNQLRIKMLL